jgi:hypothetical protein
VIWQRVMRLSGANPLDDGEDPPDRFYLTQYGVSSSLVAAWLRLTGIALVLFFPLPLGGERIAGGSGRHVGLLIALGVVAYAAFGYFINGLRFIVVYHTWRRYGSWRIWKEGGPVPAPWLRRLIEPTDFDFIVQAILAAAAVLTLPSWGGIG